MKTLVGIITIFLCSGILMSASDIPLKFENFSTEDGLSQSTVNCIYRDQKGFLWIGTVNGLNRFDGYTFKVFRPVPGDSSGFKSASIGFIYPDAKYPDNSLWIRTEDGRLYRFNPADINSLPSDKVFTCLKDLKDRIWLGTSNGLAVYNEQNNNFRRYSVQNSDSPEFENITILTLQDEINKSEDIIRLGTFQRNILKFNCQTGQIEDTDHLMSKVKGGITVIYKDLTKSWPVYWVGTYGNGLYYITSLVSGCFLNLSL